MLIVIAVLALGNGGARRPGDDSSRWTQLAANNGSAGRSGKARLPSLVASTDMEEGWEFGISAMRAVRSSMHGVLMGSYILHVGLPAPSFMPLGLHCRHRCWIQTLPVEAVAESVLRRHHLGTHLNLCGPSSSS
ncbi:hypothetical protein E2562_033116 [Oryza meyeriana var. granulata]|uniref:Secreted protein n=1 Tax=Oryza meyeriana var. granulata TaxID=110450 RepID=A0A6G1CLG0_9ORYZ|nr:hypothetical protein E2562_033116 [Oryza meyeriana var. granulata]